MENLQNETNENLLIIGIFLIRTNSNFYGVCTFVKKRERRRRGEKRERERETFECLLCACVRVRVRVTIKKFSGASPRNIIAFVV